MHDSQQAVIPVNDHSLPDRHYDDDLFLAGIAADQASTEDVFAAYHADLAENTRAKQHVDLACFSEYLAEAHVTRDPDDLYKDAYAWDRISYGIVKGFVRYLLRKGYAIGTINVRLATIRQYCKLAGPRPEGAGVLDEETLRMILTVKGYGGKKAMNLDKSRRAESLVTRRGHKKAETTAISVVQVRMLKTLALDIQHSRPRHHDALLPTRDGLLMGLLAEHAMRCSEVVALNIEDIDLEENTIRILRAKTSTNYDVHILKALSSMAAYSYLSLLREQA